MNIRTNQNDPSFNWNDFIDAIDQMHGMQAAKPAYRDFVKVHVDAMSGVGMNWHVHTMNMGGMVMRGTNFLSWHRWFVRQFEKRLQQINSSITIPYWNAITDRTIPTALQDPTLLSHWGITRDWNPDELPTQADLDAVNQIDTFSFFQRALEGPVHGGVHNAVGGDMAGASSPSDPLFWLHHANIDRIWSAWQKTHPAAHPSNLNTTLQPPPIFNVKVMDVQSTSVLGYQYK